MAEVVHLKPADVYICGGALTVRFHEPCKKLRRLFGAPDDTYTLEITYMTDKTFTVWIYPKVGRVTFCEWKRKETK